MSTFGNAMALCAAAALTAAAAQTAHAQNGYPSRPVRIIVPVLAGGAIDALARVIAQRLNEKLGAPFIVDNRPGAGGAIGLDAGARATADGHTLVILSATHVATSTLQGKRAYDLQRDFAPIIWATTQPFIVTVNPQVPARTMKELIALAKAKPGALSYGSQGAGSVQHLAGVLLGSMSDSQLFHVPYKGGTQVVNDVIGGQIQMSFTTYSVSRPHFQSGKLRALAVTTPNRLKVVPDLPSVAEVLPGYAADQWYGLIAPAKTPVAVLEALHREISTILQAPDISQRLAAEASEVVAVSRAEFGRHVGREVVKWGDVIRKAGITAH